MSTQVENILTQDPDRTARVALNKFFNIMDAWQVRVKYQIVLLGLPSESTYYHWKKAKDSSLSHDTLERISLTFGIYKALKILFPIESQANAWVHKVIDKFNGNSALSFMLKGQHIHLVDVRRYLDAQIT